MRHGLALAIALVVGFSLAALSSPARADTTADCRAAHDAAEAALRYWNGLRACVGLGRVYLPELSTESASDYVRTYERLRDHYRDRSGRLHYRLCHPRGSGAARWRPLARHCGWPERQLDRLVAVIWRESNGQPGARNGVFIGLLQIWQAHAPRLDLTNPETNLAVGLMLYRRLGWTPWAL